MTEVISEPVVPVATDDIDFAFDGMHHEENDDDFDFDLGKEPEESEQLQVTETKENDQPAMTEYIPQLPQEMQAETADEISYEEGPTSAELVNDHDDVHAHVDASEEQKLQDADEIDYEDVDLHVEAPDADADAAATVGEEEEKQEQVPQETHDGIDFGFETSQAAGDLSDNDVAEEDEVDTSLHAADGDVQGTDDVVEDGDEAHGVEDDANEEDEEEEEAAHEDLEYDTGDKSVGDDDFDFEEGEDDGESPGGSLNAGLGQLYTPSPDSSAEVTVTWGDDVCPLFKASDVDSPDSFFLEEREAVNYPLSKFLQTVRRGIAFWMHEGDEIFIRIDDLGIEFGETTTEALLHQVTFQNILALHNTLLTNDDATASKGLHITLGTRPNCLLRLKELVGGAAQGKGLSSFQQGSGSSDESSEEEEEEEENAEESDKSSPNNDEMEAGEVEEVEDEVEEEEEEDDGKEEGAPTPEADMVDATGFSMDGDVYNGEEAELAAADDGHESGDYDAGVDENEDNSAVLTDEHTDFIDYTNEDGSGDVSYGIAAGTGSESALAQDVGDAGYVSAEQQNNHVDENGLVADMEAQGHDDHNDLDLLEDFHAVVGSGQEQDESAHLEPANGLEPIGLDNQHSEQRDALGDAGHDEDDFLDLGEDHVGMEGTAAEQTAAADDLDASLGSSVTATLDHDEIDYEDHDTVAIGTELGESAEVGTAAPEPAQPERENADGLASDAVADTAGLDEIDWDDDVKNSVPSEMVSTPTTGKRMREEEGPEDDLIQDVPDLKRHRTGETPV